MLKRIRRRNRIAVAAVVALVLTAAIAGGVALARGGDKPPPGVSAGVSALTRLPPQAHVPENVAWFVTFVSRATGTDPAKALKGVRLLRQNLGAAHADVYAFKNAAGSPCFLLTGDSGTCARSPSAGTSGLHWTIGGGDAQRPSNLVGIASDDVAQVQLTVDGTQVPVSLVNNVAFGEFPQGHDHATIVVIHRDGTESTAGVALQG
jgi:hypothetical protein